MNKRIASVWLFFLCLTIGKLSAKEIIITHPVYEFKNSGAFGISLNPKEKALPASQEIPKEIAQWMQTELSKAKRQTPSDLSRDNFFYKDTARIVGYIRGYSPKSGIKTAALHIGNNLTREEQTRVIEVYEDGRFEGKLPLNYPIYNRFFMDRYSIQFYIEPGQTLGIILDWDDFLQGDYRFQKTTFAGPLAQINEELAAAEHQLPEANTSSLYEKGLKLGVKEFLAFADSATASRRNGLKTILKTESLHPTSRAVLRADHELILPYWYFAYEMDKGRQPGSSLDTTGFYDFLKQMPLDDHTLLISSDFAVFVNRFEYCAPLYKSAMLPIPTEHPSKSFKDYLYNDLKQKQTAEDLFYFKRAEEIEGKTLDEETWKEFNKINEAFMKRHESAWKDYYYEKYIKHLKQPSTSDLMLGDWANKDTTYAQVLGLSPSITYDITKIRALKVQFTQLSDREEARKFVDVLTQNVSHPFLKQEAERMYNQTFPIEKVTAYELPTSEKGTEIFRKAIDQHKGKYVFVDFWATTCGSCVRGIKEMKETRTKYKDHPDMVFVFLTGDRGASLNAYNKFVSEHELEFTHRLPEDEFVYLHQLFSFNGIPRYVLVDKEGKIMNNNYDMSQFKQTVKELGISKD